MRVCELLNQVLGATNNLESGWAAGRRLTLLSWGRLPCWNQAVACDCRLNTDGALLWGCSADRQLPFGTA